METDSERPALLTVLKRRRLGELLAEFVGPVAPMIMADLDPGLDAMAAVDRLASEITEPARAQEFRRLAAQILS